MNSRRLFWLAFLGGAVGLALIPELFFHEPDELLVTSVVPAQRETHGALRELRSSVLPATEVIASQSQQRLTHADLFAPHSWYVAPPAPAYVPIPATVPHTAPAAVAPPLPFRFIGKLEDSQQLQVFLQHGEQLYSVRAGDVIDGTYRVDAIQQARMTLTYLPLRTAQFLAVGGEP